MTETEREVWQEVKTTEEGLSVTAYSQAASQAPVVEGEAYWTWSELEAMEPPEELNDG